jgi:WD40 repeat protein
MLVPRLYPAPDDTAGFPAPVAALAFSPDGQELAVGRRHAIAIRDTTNGALRRKLTNFPERIQALSWHPDGTALLVAGGVPGRSGEAVIVDARTGTMRALLLASTDVVMAAAFSPDGSQAAVADGANTVGIHDTVSGARIRFLPAHADWVMAIAWSADGHRILTSSRDRTARIADAMTGEGLASFTGHAAPVLAGVFTPDEKRAWTVGRDRNIRAWNTDNTDEGHHTFAPSAEDTFALASFSEGFLTAGADGRLRLHPWTAPEAPILHAGGGRLIAIAATSKAKKIAAGAQDGSVRLWDPGRAEPILYLPGNGGLERPRRDQ